VDAWDFQAEEALHDQVIPNGRESRLRIPGDLDCNKVEGGWGFARFGDAQCAVRTSRRTFRRFRTPLRAVK
jgi:hypothetical protein